MASLSGKTAFVTAAGQGIGRATALAFAAAGARSSRRMSMPRSWRAGVGRDPHSWAWMCSMPRRSPTAAQDAGAVDILFNCAGVVHQGTLLEATEADWSLAFDLNCRSMFRTMQAFLPGMLARGRGSILNMASVASSLKGVPNRFIYSASKAAVIGMTRSVATDYVTQGSAATACARARWGRRAWTSGSRRTPPRPDRSRRRGRRLSRASRWDGWARRRRSPRWRSTCPATMPSSLRARRSLSMAG